MYVIRVEVGCKDEVLQLFLGSWLTLGEKKKCGDGMIFRPFRYIKDSGFQSSA
jgi:hypothetical protein